ncbi:hypothetical protein [Rhodopila sp.]|uniref:hypothetical protein n=1 Tax=Rhodopila sp. TaxID=2480087 RepID=UPI003D0E149E
MNENASSDVKAKRQILIGLSGGLSALADRMRSQHAIATKITTLAARAEAIAQRSWDLNKLNSQDLQRTMDGFVGEIKTFAKQAIDAAVRAGSEALLGKEVAEAIAAHSAEIARLTREIDSLPDAAAVRAILQPLSVTLNTLPARLKANTAMLKDVDAIGALATGLAERGDALAAGGTAGNRVAVELSRDLRQFAEEATTFSLKMASEAALAVKAISDMAQRTLGLSQGNPVSDQAPSATDRLMTLARTGPQAGQVWATSVSRTSRSSPVQGTPPGVKW